MPVKLIAITKPAIPELNSTNDLIAYVARVSNPANQQNTATAPKLVKYLAKHKHWSPFEMAHMVLEITTTRDIARQILRHRSFSFQEFSQRYAVVDQEFQAREARLQDEKNRQASLETNDDALKNTWDWYQLQVIQKAKEAYNWALDSGIAKEQARAVLPEGLTTSVLYMSGSIRSWIHYCELRCDMATQKEHRQVAQDCRNILLEQFPVLKEVMIEA